MKSANMLKRLNQEIKRRTRVAWIAPNPQTCLRRWPVLVGVKAPLAIQTFGSSPLNDVFGSIFHVHRSALIMPKSSSRGPLLPARQSR